MFPVTTATWSRWWNFWRKSQPGFKTFTIIIIVMFFFISCLPLFYCWYKFQHRILSQSRSAAPLSLSLPPTPTLFFPAWRHFLCNPLSTALLHTEGQRQKRMATRLPSFWFHLLPLQAHFLNSPFLWVVSFLCHSLAVWRFPIWLCNGVLCPQAIHHRLYTLFSALIKFYVKVRPPPLTAPAPQLVQVSIMLMLIRLFWRPLTAVGAECQTSAAKSYCYISGFFLPRIWLLGFRWGGHDSRRVCQLLSSNVLTVPCGKWLWARSSACGAALGSASKSHNFNFVSVVKVLKEKCLNSAVEIGILKT